MLRFVIGSIGVLVLLGLVSAAALEGPGDPPTLLVANKEGSSPYFVDPSSLQVEDSVATGKGPHEVAVAPGRQRAYVANYEAGTITVVNLGSRTVTDTWTLDESKRPHGIAVSSDEGSVYVTAESKDAVLDLDAATGTVKRTLRTDKDGTHMLALSRSETELFATSIGGGTLSVIDLTSGSLRSHIYTGAGAEGLAVTPDGETVWVTNRADDTVTLVDVRKAERIDSIAVPGFPTRIALSTPDTVAVVSPPEREELRSSIPTNAARKHGSRRVISPLGFCFIPPVPSPTWQIPENAG